jgi:Zn finger protein HypA/HybF involved in hydrogenase expression
MRTSSIFCAQCVCGLYFETSEREFICPKCKRLIVLEWDIADGDAHPATTDEKAESEVAA